MTTMTVSAYAGLAARAAGDPLPGSTRSCCRRSARSERRVALPLLLMVPVLFIAGVAFGYFVVLDRAVDFLLNFNDEPVQHPGPGARLLQLRGADAARDGPGVPGPAGDPGGHAAGHHDARSSCVRGGATLIS